VAGAGSGAAASMAGRRGAAGAAARRAAACAGLAPCTAVCRFRWPQMRLGPSRVISLQAGPFSRDEWLALKWFHREQGALVPRGASAGHACPAVEGRVARSARLGACPQAICNAGKDECGRL
jgi:hypothetical protein